MSRDEIDNNLSKSIDYLQEFEKIAKTQETTFDIHMERIEKLRYLVRRLSELHRLEVAAQINLDIPLLNKEDAVCSVSKGLK